MKPIDTANREHAFQNGGKCMQRCFSKIFVHIGNYPVKNDIKKKLSFKIVLRLLPAGKKIRNMNKAKCCKFDMLDLLSSSFVSSSLKQ